MKEAKLSNTNNTDKQVIIFSLAQEKYALPILSTREIILSSQLTPLPNVPEYIEGLINLRGEIIPVINLYKKFNLENKKNKTENFIIIIEQEEKKVGLLVDQVIGIMNLSEEQLMPPPKALGQKSSHGIKQIIKLENSLVMLLAIDKLLAESVSYEIS